MLNSLKRNQIIVFAITLMLVAAGYLNYFSIQKNNSNIETNANNIELSKIGDARLVSSNAIEESEKEEQNNNDTVYEDEIVNEAEIIKIDNNIDENENKTVQTNSINNKDEYFSQSKLERDAMYSQMIETYTKILENENISANQKTIAQTEIKNINDNKNKIMICENLIKSKGIENSVIFVNGDSISVILRIDDLSNEQIAQIQNIINREMRS